MTRVHVSMIVRNEVNRHLGRSIACAVEIARLNHGLLIVTDDASTDGTDQYVRHHTEHVQVFDEPRFLVHEGRARQAHYEFMSSLIEPDDWVLSLDADETVNRPELVSEKVRDANRTGTGLVLMELIELWRSDPMMQRVDGYWATQMAMRLYRFEEGGQIRDKEMASHSAPDYAIRRRYDGTALAQNELHLLHWGYMREEDRRAKYARYIDRPGHNPKFIRSILEPPSLREYRH